MRSAANAAMWRLRFYAESVLGVHLAFGVGSVPAGGELSSRSSKVGGLDAVSAFLRPQVHQHEHAAEIQTSSGDS